ncbi:hypothetical protein SeLEV6574_g05891 [Synchytrium endobioticum]|uniref:Integrase catalytic domain-containing protein n=1 Tax=Synchytrium endobioticum TaxID=286115 RepID=A0A507CRU4_9FUNG|nr:hypothetical protein SeLEV6574_g05891 [Synchytrium endobioticum]
MQYPHIHHFAMTTNGTELFVSFQLEKPLAQRIPESGSFLDRGERHERFDDIAVEMQRKGEMFWNIAFKLGRLISLMRGMAIYGWHITRMDARVAQVGQPFGRMLNRWDSGIKKVGNDNRQKSRIGMADEYERSFWKPTTTNILERRCSGCPTRLHSPESSKAEAKEGESDEEEGSVVVSSVADTINDSLSMTWLLGGGASRHMTSDATHMTHIRKANISISGIGNTIFKATQKAIRSTISRSQLGIEQSAATASVNECDSEVAFLWHQRLGYRDAAKPLMDLIRLLQNQHGTVIKYVQLDNAPEFTSHRMKEFLLERERAKTLMAACGLPATFWVDALLTAVYLENRSTTRALATKITPYEMLYRKPPIMAISGEARSLHGNTESIFDVGSIGPSLNELDTTPDFTEYPLFELGNEEDDILHSPQPTNPRSIPRVPPAMLFPPTLASTRRRRLKISW